jgi:Tfp pilus assembly protein PilF
VYAGRGEASFETINVCLHKYPGFEEALCFRGRLYLQRGECGRAEEDFKAAVGVRKPSFLSYVGLADCYRAMNRN